MVVSIHGSFWLGDSLADFVIDPNLDSQRFVAISHDNWRNSRKERFFKMIESTANYGLFASSGKVAKELEG